MNSGDTAWILASTALVVAMVTPGLALFYAGLVRQRNVLSILAQCLAVLSLVSILWVVCGYGLAFGESLGGVIGIPAALGLLDIRPDDLNGTLPALLFVAFQMTFAAITPALIVGGFAERMRFSSVLMFSALWSLLVYAPVCHWIWGGGWLGQMGVMDFAGGLVVHLTAGVAALVVAMLLGPRTGFLKGIVPHNLPLVATGTGLLWVGWFGFNGGSALAADGSAASALLSTHLGAGAAVLSWLALEKKVFGQASFLGGATGAIAGLGTITPASGYVGPLGAIVLGLIAGAVCFQAVILLKRRLKIDDALDVFPVHGVGGILGSLMVAFLGASALGGVGLERGVWAQFGVQLLAVAAVALWTLAGTWVSLKISTLILGNPRVDTESEELGLDIAEHGERGYNL